ncbi:MAG: porin [Sphingobacteriales bacterium]|nr:porin [Sphingobacteriales bacterium]MBI3718268.1 porin [Sphingobacteriales bacterium]
MKDLPRKALLALTLLLISAAAQSQFLMDMIDTSKETGKGMLALYRKFDRIKIGGYIQPEFQFAQSKGVKSFEGGDFAPQVNNRFLLRRSRVRIDYVHFGNEDKPGLGVQIAFQFDANERGFTVRDVWGRIFENKWKLFSFTTGMFARPFGYEVNLSSSDRESPERGRMSQLHMKSERDLGAMISFDVRKKDHLLKNLKIDAGIFNGQGIVANGEFDNTKDFIGRVSIKPVTIKKGVQLSAGTSLLYGGLNNNTRYVFTTNEAGGAKKIEKDSSITNVGKISPRRYYGADVQLKIKNGSNQFTELRGEVLAGTQTGTANSAETPTALLSGTDGFFQRRFNGAYFYFLQHLFSRKHQLVIKYDWYDPNTEVKGDEIGTTGSNFTAADIKYTTLGLGYNNYISDNIKLTLYYAIVWNETTQLAGYTNDINDNVVTCRVQFRF